MRRTLSPAARAAAGLWASAVLLLAACSSGGSSDGGLRGSDRDGSPPATGPAASGGSGSLEDLAFDEGDLADGEQAVVPADGTSVSDASPTLAFCQIELPTEAERQARHRVQILDDGHAGVATTEAVRYPTGASSTAINELRSAFMDCPEDEPVDIGEGELVTYDAMPIYEPELDGLARDHVGADITATAADGTVEESTVVVQRRGDVLIAVQGTDHERVVELATDAGRRLQAADGAVVGD